MKEWKYHKALQVLSNVYEITDLHDKCAFKKIFIMHGYHFIGYKVFAHFALYGIVVVRGVAWKLLYTFDRLETFSTYFSTRNVQIE